MAITLGGITLPDDLVLEGIENAAGVAMSTRRTLGGRRIVTMGPSLITGRDLALQSENHLTLPQVTAIKALEALGQTVLLVHPRASINVIITGVEVEPDTMLVNPANSTDQWWSGTINMIEV